MVLYPMHTLLVGNWLIWVHAPVADLNDLEARIDIGSRVELFAHSRVRTRENAAKNGAICRLFTRCHA